MGGGSGLAAWPGVLGVAKGGGVAKGDEVRTWRGWPTPHWRAGGVMKEASAVAALAGLGGVCGIVSDDQGKDVVEGVRGDMSLWLSSRGGVADVNCELQGWPGWGRAA